MKNNGLRLLVFFILILLAFVVYVSSEDYKNYKNYKKSCDNLKSTYNKPLKTNPDPFPQDLYLVEIDSCEYIWSYKKLTHKGNCKYCKERREKELQELLKSINKENE